MFARYHITDESDQRQALLNGQSYNVAAASPLSTKREAAQYHNGNSSGENPHREPASLLFCLTL